MAEQASWPDEDDEDDSEELRPEDMADPACAECGGAAGWVVTDALGREQWVWCDCIEWLDEGDDDD